MIVKFEITLLPIDIVVPYILLIQKNHHAAMLLARF